MTERISSTQNPRVKQAVKLRDRRQRDKQGRILIDGARELSRAIESGVELLEVFTCPALCRSDDCRAAVQSIAQRGIETIEVAPAVFAKMAYGERAEGLLAVALAPRSELDDVRLPDRPLVVVLEGVEKPGNVGAVLRTADAAGAAAVLVTDAATDLYNPNAIRASMGAIFTVPVRTCEATAALDWLLSHQLQIFAARVDAQVDYTAVDLTGGLAIVVGSEARGLSTVWTGEQVTPVRLPMLGRVDSLNVSTTTAILVYEALRQRRATGSPG